MSYPVTLTVTFDFSNGPVFGYPFTIGDPQHGILGTNVLANSASDVVDISDQVTKVSTRGAYNLIQDQFVSNTCSVTVIDPNGDWNPQNTASPYYGKLVPLRKLRISATYLGQSYFIFSGYTDSYNYTYPKDQEYGYVQINCSDAFRLFNLANISTVASATAGQDTGTRIGKILDQIQWPSSMRSITTGGSETTCQADPGTNRTALQALKMVEYTEQGAFYIGSTGNAVFKSRAQINSYSGQNPTVFSNGGTDIPYNNIVFAFDDKLIINQTNAQNIGGTMQSASNATSISTYFPHSFTQQNLLAQTNADALNIALLYTATRAFTTLRIDAMTLDLSDPAMVSAGIIAALSLDYFNTVQITNYGQTTSTGGTSTITKTLQVMGASHEITPNTWKATFSVSEPLNASFIIGSSIYGVIGDPNYLSVMSY
ncbi:hypothetical protein UFOVP1255_10 [uncultured Caudovirales phage]|uniref:Uncharacterized protein n=1 Tax=uncultured Caudovirales phage TaxID=2100421 RepID=A0A6J5PR87_9CAUD|nr:hypothetical protein UFOVP973_5 [uncultured Caudovirales phage]CAB4194038.1 hypothetical protein UFOVP1255_10 [uncultured Caudovirales phage]CAB4216888.1 hypothetical protein UFOVP1496_13 [uncultured Caudovirales phage]